MKSYNKPLFIINNIIQGMLSYHPLEKNTFGNTMFENVLSLLLTFSVPNHEMVKKKVYYLNQEKKI